MSDGYFSDLYIYRVLEIEASFRPYSSDEYLEKILQDRLKTVGLVGSLTALV